MITSNSRGWTIYYRNGEWYYLDNDAPYDDSRPCKRCGRYPTKEGYDACLGYIEGAKFACCGHGNSEGYVIMRT